MTSHPKLPRTTGNEPVTCEQSKTYQNDSVDTNRLMRFQRIKHWSLFILWGTDGRGPEDLELNKVKFSRSLLWMLLPWSRSPYGLLPEVIPPNNIWWLSRPPPPPSLCLHFPSKFEWSSLWILPKFSVIPPFRFLVTTDSPFCSPTN